MSQPKIIYWAYISVNDELKIVTARTVKRAYSALNAAAQSPKVKWILEPLEVSSYEEALISFTTMAEIGSIKIKYREISKIKIL